MLQSITISQFALAGEKELKFYVRRKLYFCKTRIYWWNESVFLLFYSLFINDCRRLTLKNIVICIVSDNWLFWEQNGLGTRELWLCINKYLKFKKKKNMVYPQIIINNNIIKLDEVQYFPSAYRLTYKRDKMMKLSIVLLLLLFLYFLCYFFVGVSPKTVSPEIIYFRLSSTYLTTYIDWLEIWEHYVR